MFLWIIFGIVLFYWYSRKEGLISLSPYKDDISLQNILKNQKYKLYSKNKLDKNVITFKKRQLQTQNDIFFKKTYGEKDNIFITINKYNDLLKNINDV